MTVSTESPTQGTVPEDTMVEAETGGRGQLLKRALLVVSGVVLIFVLTYAFAWFNASQLSARFIQDADDSYDSGDYLQALVGSEEFDPQTNEFVNKGGYLNVERIWSSSYSWPEPPVVVRARERSQEIVDQRLTIEMAEDYIRANTGRPAPYFAEIYLRLGELYEEDGDVMSAREIYESIPDLFSRRPDLIEQAREHLERLEGG